MDFRAVALIFLCLLTAQAAHVTVNLGAVNATVQEMQRETRTAMDKLTADGLLPDRSCASLNISRLLGAEQQPSAAHQLPSFWCLVLKMSELTPQIKDHLLNIAHYARDLGWLTSDQAALQACSPPTFKYIMDKFEFVKCLLELLQK